MLKLEAQWLKQALDGIPADSLSPLVNLGSSSRRFRERKQGFIQEDIIQPLEDRGVKIIHVDLEDDEGVDIAGDIFDENTFNQIKSHAPKSIICANVLEHVLDPPTLADRCTEISDDAGYAFVTVPHSFPYHLAPIDTLFRPSVEEIEALFPDCTLESGTIVNCGSFGKQLVKSPSAIARHLAKMIIPWPSFDHWKATMSRNAWLFKDYRVSCAVFKKI